MKDNNKGYTLIEILIVMAILAVVTSAATVSFRLIYNTKVTTSARIIQSTAKTARLNNMTKQKLKYIHLVKTDGINYMYVDETKDVDISKVEQQLGNTDMGISYGPMGGTIMGLGNGKSITIYFDRSGRCYVYNSSGNPVANVDTIIFSNGTRTSTVNISRITGKVSMD